MAALVTGRRIVRGYAFVHRLAFQSPAGGAPAMPALTAAARITCAVRAAARAGTTTIVTLDTADGSLQVVDAVTLRLNIPAAWTALFPLGGVTLDLERLDGGAWSPLPVVFPAWPVRRGAS